MRLGIGVLQIRNVYMKRLVFLLLFLKPQYETELNRGYNERAY